MRVFPHRLQFPLHVSQQYIPSLPPCVDSPQVIIPLSSLGQCLMFTPTLSELHDGVFLALLFLEAKPPLTLCSRSRRLQLNELRSHLLQQDFRSCGATNIYGAASKRLQRHDFLLVRALVDLFALSHIRLVLIAKELYNHC